MFYDTIGQTVCVTSYWMLSTGEVESRTIGAGRLMSFERVAFELKM